MPGYRVPSSVRLCHLGSTSPPGGAFLGLTVGSPAHSPRGPDRSCLIHGAPGLTRLHLTVLHTALGQAASAALSRQTWAQTHLLFPTCSPSWTSPCLSKPVGVHTCTPGMMPAGLLGMSSDPGGTRPGKHGSPCLRQAVPPALYVRHITVLLSVPLLMPTHSPFRIPSAWVCVSVGICAHSLEARGTLPPNREGR